MKINEVARLTGVTVRTLHYYDEIGLLTPSEVTEAGYRLYDSSALATLQQILFFRELDFPLSEIKVIMTNPAFDQSQALATHKELLMKKRQRLDGLIALVNQTLKGDGDMSFKEFDSTEIERCKQQYATEVQERFGKTDAYAESEVKTAQYGKAQWQQISTEGADLLQGFADCKINAPDSEAAQGLVKQWQNFITAKFYHCTKEILSCLGQMYVGDSRFTENIDRHGDGTAAFMAKAIEIYCAL